QQVAARWSYGGGVGRSHGVSSWSSREAPPVVRSAPWMGWVDGLQAEDMGSVVQPQLLAARDLHDPRRVHHHLDLAVGQVADGVEHGALGLADRIPAAARVG